MVDSSRILVVLLNYRTADMTLGAARAALRAMEQLHAELVIVDNASGDGSAETIATALETQDWARGANVRLIESDRNGGFGAGNNIGIRAGLSDGSRPDYVYLLNSDAFPAPDAIMRLVQHLEAHSDVGIAGSYIHGPDGEAHVTAFRFPGIAGEIEAALRLGVVSRLLRRYQVPMGVPQATCRVDWLAGASMMIRDSLLQEIGAFDERFFLYFEETDLCLRAMQAGFETHYVRDSHVEHIGSVSTGMKSWDRVPGYWLDSRWHYFVKNHGRGYAALATLARAAAQAVWNTRRVIQQKPAADPAHFLRDLLVHDVRALFSRAPDEPPIPARRGEIRG